MVEILDRLVVQTIVSPTFANSIVKQGNTFVIRGLAEGRHVVVATRCF